MTDFKAKMHLIRFRLGLRPRPRWGSLQRSPRPLAGFGGRFAAGRLGSGRGGKGEVKWREREDPKLLLNQGPSEPCYATEARPSLRRISEPLICFHVDATINTLSRRCPLSSAVPAASCSFHEDWARCGRWPVIVAGKYHSGTEVARMPTATIRYPIHQQPIHRGSPGTDPVSGHAPPVYNTRLPDTKWLPYCDTTMLIAVLFWWHYQR